MAVRFFAIAGIVNVFLHDLCANARTGITVSRTLTIDGQAYYLPHESFSPFPDAIISDDVLPLTVITTNESTITGDLIRNTIEGWKKSDDVFSDSFLQSVLLFQTGQNTATVTASATSFLAEKSVEKLFLSGIRPPDSGNFSTIEISRVKLPAGPYVLSKDPSGSINVYEPRKLFFDETQSFFKSVHPLKDGSFTVVSASLDTDSSPYIGVPSRVYAEAKDKNKLPLAGVRVTVKDIYFLKGLKASCGNRAFYMTYGARNATGPAVARLGALGADIVGMTKTVQFANGDRATADWVDYHAPFVLRGDGYREPSGSSTGAGASTSTHDWLDVGIGSDTGGSIRGPAGANGIYGIRPSVGAISLDKVMPLSDVLDTAGYLARDPRLFRSFGKAWYGENTMFRSYPSFPTKLLLSPDFQGLTPAATDVYNSFFAQLQACLGASVQNFTIADAWNTTSGVGVPVNSYLNETYPTLIAFHQWTVLGAKLFEDYAAANGGRKPHINPAVLARWEYGQMRGLANYTAEVARQQTFESWTADNFLLEDPQACSQSIYLYPQNAGTYDSREEYFLGPSSPPFGFSDSRVAVHARSPDMVIPIGQVPYASVISGIQEVLPVTVSLVARRGCDFMLLDLVGALAEAGIVQTVKTGRTAF
ncbi:amidase signature enzyme [Phellopilus nigrolimitatus]|nr:amidase signature enzyme [Phellopilus nigrolimitatus]